MTAKAVMRLRGAWFAAGWPSCDEYSMSLPKNVRKARRRRNALQSGVIGCVSEAMGAIMRFRGQALRAGAFSGPAVPNLFEYRRDLILDKPRIGARYVRFRQATLAADDICSLGCRRGFIEGDHAVGALTAKSAI
jgi:hypothetical protein